MGEGIAAARNPPAAGPLRPVRCMTQTQDSNSDSDMVRDSDCDSDVLPVDSDGDSDGGACSVLLTPPTPPGWGGPAAACPR